MRASGPKHRRRPVLLALLAVLVGCVAIVAGAARADDPDALRAEADRLQAENASLDEQTAAVLLELYALESRLRGGERRLERLRLQATRVEERQASAQRQLALARRSETAAQRALAERVRALYIGGTTDPLAVILSASSLEGVIDAIDTVNRVADRDARIIEQLHRTRGELRAALAELAQRERELRSLTGKAEEEAAAVASAHDRRAAYLASLARERDLNAHEIALLVDRASEAEQRGAEVTASAPSATDPEPAPAPSAEPAPGVVDVSPEAGRQVTVSVTKYCLLGTTATGVPVQHGIIATDPSYIPLGTRMYVPGYGEGVAADTGGAVLGWTIDLWVASCAEAVAYGRQTATITIY